MQQMQKNGTITRAQRGTFLHHEPENKKQLSSSAIFANIWVDDTIGTVGGMIDGSQKGGQTTLTDQATMQAEKMLKFCIWLWRLNEIQAYLNLKNL